MSALLLDAENLSVTAPADYPLSRLQENLKGRGLCYPPAIDLLTEETVGAHLSNGSCGPWRLGRGTARDWVLSLDVLTGRGELIRTGSGVIKNVAGLDLTKLMIGSLGRLGAINSAISPRTAAGGYQHYHGSVPYPRSSARGASRSTEHITEPRRCRVAWRDAVRRP